LWDLCRDAVTPITIIHDTEDKQLGTGTFFQLADHFFLVTAAHVWDQATQRGAQGRLYVFNNLNRHEGEVDLQPVLLLGRIYLFREPLDVAVMQLEESVVPQLSGCQFLRLDKVCLRPPGRGFYWVYGYPQETAEWLAARSLFRFSQFFLLASRVEKEPCIDNYDPQVHMVLEAARDDLTTQDGTPCEMPYSLGGISGGSIWYTPWPGTVLPDISDMDGIRVVGVQTSYYPKPSIIKATRWSAVARLLHEARPDLRPILRMHLGA
jgi:hypothetical protein